MRRTSSVVVEVLDDDGVVVNGEDGAADVREVGQLAYYYIIYYIIIVLLLYYDTYLDGHAEDGAHTHSQHAEDLHVNYLK